MELTTSGSAVRHVPAARYVTEMRYAALVEQNKQTENLFSIVQVF